jgi:small subunit ribosomal protein S4
MARQTGPTCKTCRQAGEKLFLKGDKCVSDKCILPRRMEKEGPGRGGKTGRRRGGRKLSAYSIQLREKQRVKSVYGLAETQFRIYFRRAAKEPNTAEALLNMLETRLDNVIYRLGFAGSRPQARQLVVHGHITINGRKTDIPSCLVRAGQVIGVKDEKGLKAVRTMLATKDTPGASWLNLDKDSVKGTVVRLPGPEDTKDMAVNMQLIVELYSK